MKRTLTAIAAVALTATAMTACHKKMPEQTAQADTATPAAIPLPTDGYTTGQRVTVPEMKPTGDMASATDPNKPSIKSPGAAPQMAPTGNEREPYKPQPNGT